MYVFVRGGDEFGLGWGIKSKSVHEEIAKRIERKYEEKE